MYCVTLSSSMNELIQYLPCNFYIIGITIDMLNTGWIQKRSIGVE